MSSNPNYMSDAKTKATSPGPRFRTQYNHESFPRGHEHNTAPSETIPDQTMSIATIMARYARGLPADGSVKTPLWDPQADIDDEFLPDPRHMDLADRQALREGATETVAQIRSRLQADEQARKDAKDKPKGESATKQEPKPDTPEKPPQNEESKK